MVYTHRRAWVVAERFSLRLVIPFLLVAWACDHVSAQTTGGISGVVRNSSGAIVAKASIQVVNDATNATWRTTTDQAGSYSLWLLPPGVYRLEVTKDAFSIAVLTNV